MEYDDIARNIIEAEQEIIGDVALRQAASLDWIDLDDGEITITGDPDADDIDALVSTYEDIMGQAALGTARRVIADLDLDGVTLPDRLHTD